MKFIKATIVRGFGTDKVSIDTDLSTPLPKSSEENLCLNFDAEPNTAIEYLRLHFPEINVIHVINRNDGSHMVLKDGKMRFEVPPRSIKPFKFSKKTKKRNGAKQT